MMRFITPSITPSLHRRSVTALPCSYCEWLVRTGRASCCRPANVFIIYEHRRVQLAIVKATPALFYTSLCCSVGFEWLITFVCGYLRDEEVMRPPRAVPALPSLASNALNENKKTKHA
jgi:hypothetical protein